MNKKLLYGLYAGLSLLAACRGTDSGSTLSQNAQPIDPNVKVYNVLDVDRLIPVLVTGGKGYKLECSDPNKLIELVNATGYPYSVLGTERPVSIDSELAQQWQINSQPALSCDASGKKLYKVEYPAQTKYFFANTSSSDVPTNRLYMIGCHALLGAMGFSLDDAQALNPELIVPGSLIDASDDYDINCLTGVEVAAAIEWEQLAEGTVDVSPGQGLTPFTYSAKTPSGNFASISHTTEGYCDWLQTYTPPNSLFVLGTVPGDFENQNCTLKVTASGEGVPEAYAQITFRNRIAPILSHDCAIDQSIESLDAYSSCQLSSDYGSIRMENQSCPGLFVFDTTQATLSLSRLPSPDQRCEATFVASFEDLASEPKTFSVIRTCAIGYENRNGQCEIVRCDSEHVFGDIWSEPIPHGERQLECQANGSTRIRQLTCSTGYQANGNSCQPVRCNNAHVFPDRWTNPIDHGEQRLQCNALGNIEILDVSCESGYEAQDRLCKPASCGIRRHNETWTVEVLHGRRHYTCSYGQISETLYCNNRYEVKLNRCVPKSCAGGRDHGETWSTNITNGKRNYRCSYGSISSSLSCNRGYELKSGRCVAKTCSNGKSYGDTWRVRTGKPCIGLTIINYRCSVRTNGTTYIEVTSRLEIPPEREFCGGGRGPRF